MESYLFIVQMMYKSLDSYDWFCAPGSDECQCVRLRGGGAPPAAAGSSFVCRPAAVSCSCPGCVFAGAGVFVCLSPAADAETPVSTWTLRED